MNTFTILWGDNNKISLFGLSEVTGSNPVQVWYFFSGDILTTALVVVLTVMIIQFLRSLPCVKVISLVTAVLIIQAESKALCSENCFSNLDTASTSQVQLKIKETLHIASVRKTPHDWLTDWFYWITQSS